MMAQSKSQLRRLTAQGAVSPAEIENFLLGTKLAELSNTNMRSKNTIARLHVLIGHKEEQAARWKARAKAAEGSLKKHDVDALVYKNQEATRIARAIHEALKRGEATEDHGLLGNLRCILDYIVAKYDPDPDAPAAKG